MASTEDTTTTPEPAGRSQRRGQVGRTALIVSVIVALAVGGIAGIAIGWKVEQQRVKDDTKDLRPVGTITSVSDKSITISLRTASGSRTYAITSGTVIDEARRGSESDLVEGARVIVQSFEKNGKREASAIVVLPDSTKFGD